MPVKYEHLAVAAVAILIGYVVYRCVLMPFYWAGYEDALFKPQLVDGNCKFIFDVKISQQLFKDIEKECDSNGKGVWFDEDYKGSIN